MKKQGEGEPLTRLCTPLISNPRCGAIQGTQFSKAIKARSGEEMEGVASPDSQNEGLRHPLFPVQARRQTDRETERRRRECQSWLKLLTGSPSFDWQQPGQVRGGSWGGRSTSPAWKGASPPSSCSALAGLPSEVNPLPGAAGPASDSPVLENKGAERRRTCWMAPLPSQSPRLADLVCKCECVCVL